MANQPAKKKEPLPEIVDRKCKRKMTAKKEKPQTIFFGLGVFGVVNWSVAIPTIIGVMIGRWLDARSDMQISWTLTMIFAGVFVGLIIAWNWMNREGKSR